MDGSQGRHGGFRAMAGLVVAAGVAWLGSQILGEYPFRGWLPVLGGLLLGLSTTGAVGFVTRGEPVWWAVILAAALAVWGEALAVRVDLEGVPTPCLDCAFRAPDLGSWQWEHAVAVVAAAVGGLFRLVSPRRRAARVSG